MEDPSRSLFWSMAKEDALLSERQCAILQEVFAAGEPVTEIADLARICGICRDPGALADLAARVTEEMPAAGDAGGGPEPAAAATSDIPADLQWFCSEAVSRGILDRATCVSLLSCLDGAANLLTFAEMVVSYGFCGDHAAIQALCEDAKRRAAAGQKPDTTNLFG